MKSLFDIYRGSIKIIKLFLYNMKFEEKLQAIYSRFFPASKEEVAPEVKLAEEEEEEDKVEEEAPAEEAPAEEVPAEEAAPAEEEEEKEEELSDLDKVAEIVSALDAKIAALEEKIAALEAGKAAAEAENAELSAKLSTLDAEPAVSHQHLSVAPAKPLSRAQQRLKDLGII